MRSVTKMTVRSIRTHFARFMAILLIVMLSAGFFAGLKVTTDAIRNTGDLYLQEQKFYDFRILSALGFTQQDVAQIGALPGVQTAEGSYVIDALLQFEESVSPFKIYALNEKTNLPSLVTGRMPQAEGECLADVDRYTEADIGKTFTVSKENDPLLTSQLKTTEFTIVGLVNSPLHLGLDRGTTTIGSGTVDTFLYIEKECFLLPVYTEVNVTLTERAPIYSDAYDALIEKHQEPIEDLCNTLAKERYDALLSEQQITPDMAAVLGMEAPQVYVLTRSENAGYMSFENDTGIISGVANIFPVFFIAIAILVCMTTMTRMVDEERTQIGVLKAMGFRNTAIMGKYLLYAGVATLLGWAVGFFVCTWALPKIFWFAYNEIYNFAPITYLFSSSLAVITLLISLLSILGSTYLSCRKELSDAPATLIRPRVGKSGKRILLERVTPLWKKLSFLSKITARNMFRYKQRLFMMLIGIGCCAGLLVTAFGVRDSMIGVGEEQYNDIQKYEIEASFDEGTVTQVQDRLALVDSIDGYVTVKKDYVDLAADTSMFSVQLISSPAHSGLQEYFSLRADGEPLAIPGIGEALISPKIAEKLSLSVGDSLEIRDADMRTGRVVVGGIFDNHIYDYVVISDQTYSALFDTWTPNTALIRTDEDTETVAKALTELDVMTSITQLPLMEKNISDALSCLNYIIWLIVFFSGALAFIVIFNLTNINIAERRREIATVQVLGFYPKETESYVLKENLILSFVAGILGLPLGKLFHMTVMSMVKIDLISFDSTVHPISYLLAFICTVLFAFVVNCFMKRQLNKVNMAESLKAVE